MPKSGLSGDSVSCERDLPRTVKQFPESGSSQCPGKSGWVLTGSRRGWPSAHRCLAWNDGDVSRRRYWVENLLLLVPTLLCLAWGGAFSRERATAVIPQPFTWALPFWRFSP